MSEAETDSSKQKQFFLNIVLGVVALVGSYLVFSQIPMMVNIFSNADNFEKITTGLGTFLIGLMALFAAGSAADQFKNAKNEIKDHAKDVDKNLFREEFRFQVATESVDIFNRAKIDLSQIRSPAVFEGELKELQDLPENQDFVTDMKKNRNSGIVFLRLDKKSETFAKLNSLQTSFRAIFEDDEPFRAIQDVRHQIWVSAMMLHTGHLSSEERKEHYRVIWATSSNDEIQVQVNNAVRRVEELCFPVIRGELNEY